MQSSQRDGQAEMMRVGVWKGERNRGGERERGSNGILVFVLLLPLPWNLF